MTFESVQIKVPAKMITYVNPQNEETELLRNALMLYPYIKDLTISHGRAAEILGIDRLDLIDLYGDLGLPYIDMDISEVENELSDWRELKKRGK